MQKPERRLDWVERMAVEVGRQVVVAMHADDDIRLVAGSGSVTDFEREHDC